ncbi:ech hydrogenase subunit B [Desulfitispora alkaliphila]|uniref:respiratory chain complex I subunit 1 family protein n=1 Tax=Desulfitispora alkaliphila TaxID=622674 RepID=UPI003D1D6E45
MREVLIVLGVLVLAPMLGVFINGIDRIITARMQGRVGPPLLQPLYDVIKLFNKDKMIVNKLQVFYAIVYLVFAATALALFALGGDLLLIIFVLAVGAGALVLGALSVKSPYSQIGAHRELMQILAYEPILILTAVTLFLVTGSFKVDEIVAFQAANNSPLLFTLPLLFIALTYVLTIKMRKSPFDISTSHHAHQEVVRGVTTEYSGVYLGILEIAHWYELLLVLGMIGLFWANNWILAVALIMVAFILELLIDNTTSRLTWRWMLRSTWVFGMGLGTINLIYVYIIR